MIYFTSDLHLGHKNICKGTTNWENKERTRDFHTVEEMDDEIINNINNIVQKNDELYILGDFCFGKAENIVKYRYRINCDRVHLIFGNHDETIINDQPINYKGNVYWPQHLFVSCSHYKEIKIGKRFIVLSHYAMRVWNKSHHGSYMLYGHSHGALDEMQPNFAEPNWISDSYFIKNYKTMDVGIDNINRLFGSYKPISISELDLIFEKKEILFNHEK